MNSRQFIEYVSADLAQHGVRMRFVDASSLDKKYAGWFDADNRKLVLARRHRDFIGILLHEYCHFRQWLENRKSWNQLSRKGDPFFAWLDSQKPLSRKVLDAKLAAQALEYDCEYKAIALVKKLQLPLDVKEYSQKANAYLLSYHLMAIYHQWPGKGSVYSPSIRQLMPARLLPLSDIRQEKTLTTAMIKKFNRCFHL